MVMMRKDDLEGVILHVEHPGKYTFVPFGRILSSECRFLGVLTLSKSERW